MRHQIQSILLTLLLLASSDSAWAQFTFITNADTSITITGYTGSNDVVIIPDTINGLPVDGLYDYSFEYADITAVIFSDEVKSIGFAAFAGCSNLTNVIFSKNVTSIGNYAFQNCRQLSDMTINGNNYFHWPDFFPGCINLTNVSIGATVTNLSNRAFIGWSSLTALNVNPSNIVYSSVDGVLFDKGTNILMAYPNGRACNYIVPNGVVSLAESAFESCSGLTGVTIPDGVAEIGSYAFYECAGLTFVTMGGSVTNIGDGAFISCVNLTNIVMGTSLVRIGVEAFGNCYSLTCVTLPESVSDIEYLAFAACVNLNDIFFLGNAPSLVGAFVFNSSPTTAYYLPGTTGWSDFASNAQIPAIPWLPQMQAKGSNFGGGTNQFAFNIHWASGRTVVVEASADLVNWQPVQTNTLTTGSINFSDPQQTNFPNRFYRVRSP